MNKKGVGVIGAIFLFMVFLIIIFVALGGWVGQMGSLAVTSANLTGIEAFFYSNLPLVIFICMILGMMGIMYFSGK